MKYFGWATSITLGGVRGAMTEKMGLIGPEVSDRAALDLPLDRAEILVTNKELLKKTREEWRALPGADQIQVVGLERGGVPIPIGDDTHLQRMDLVTVVGVKSAVQKIGDTFGRVVRPSAATDLLTLSAGMILGFLIGAIQFPAFGASVGLGNAGGLSGLGCDRFFGRFPAPLLWQYPAAARNVLEDLGLVVFVAIVGINAGNLAARAIDRCDCAKDLPDRLCRVLHPACHCLDDWALHLQVQCRYSDGSCCRCPEPQWPMSRSCRGDPVQRTLDRLPGRLRRIGHPADRSLGTLPWFWPSSRGHDESAARWIVRCLPGRARIPGPLPGTRAVPGNSSGLPDRKLQDWGIQSRPGDRRSFRWPTRRPVRACARLRHDQVLLVSSFPVRDWLLGWPAVHACALKRDGLKPVLLAVVVCITGLAASILVAKVLRLDPGFAAGLHVG